MINSSKYITLILLFILALTTTSSGQVSDSKTIKKGFTIDKSSIIEIDNKYGDITIETWNKDSVFVEITYEVSDKNHEKTSKKMEEINFELAQSGHYIIINTILENQKNMFTSEISKFKKNMGVGVSKVEIDMLIKLPDNLDLRLKNKFGNIYIDDYKGDLRTDLSNGRFKAHHLSGYSNLKISFGDAIINSIDTGNLEVNYSDMNLTSARKLRITSKTSDITITEIEQLLVNSSRDDYHIRAISDFEAQANWTDFSISDFKKQSDIKMNYGELTIDNIRSSFENIKINAKSTKINLFFDRDVDVNFDITTNKDMDLPMEAEIDSTEQISEKDKIIRYKGRTGTIDIDAPQLIIETTSTEISILKR